MRLGVTGEFDRNALRMKGSHAAFHVLLERAIAGDPDLEVRRHTIAQEGPGRGQGVEKVIEPLAGHEPSQEHHRGLLASAGSRRRHEEGSTRRQAHARRMASALQRVVDSRAQHVDALGEVERDPGPDVGALAGQRAGDAGAVGH